MILSFNSLHSTCFACQLPHCDSLALEALYSETFIDIFKIPKKEEEEEEGVENKVYFSLISSFTRRGKRTTIATNEKSVKGIWGKDFTFEAKQIRDFQCYLRPKMVDLWLGIKGYHGVALPSSRYLTPLVMGVEFHTYIRV